MSKTGSFETGLVTTIDHCISQYDSVSLAKAKMQLDTISKDGRITQFVPGTGLAFYFNKAWRALYDGRDRLVVVLEELNSDAREAILKVINNEKHFNNLPLLIHKLKSLGSSMNSARIGIQQQMIKYESYLDVWGRMNRANTDDIPYMITRISTWLDSKGEKHNVRCDDLPNISDCDHTLLISSRSTTVTAVSNTDTFTSDVSTPPFRNQHSLGDNIPISQHLYLANADFVGDEDSTSIP